MSLDPRATIIDMTPDGRFREPARGTWGVQATGWSAIAVIAAGALLGIVLAVWLAITILPVVVAVALVALVVSRLRSRRRRGLVPGPLGRR